MPTRIVDVGDKPSIRRRATAQGALVLRPHTLEAIRQGTIEKGDVIRVSEVAALMAVKRTPDWLPLCHPLSITHVAPAFSAEPDRLLCTVTVETTAQTGVEMEALTGVSAGLLCAWDMVKPLEKDENGQYPDTRIEDLRVVSKEKATEGAT